MNHDKQVRLLNEALANANRLPVDGEETLVATSDYIDSARFQLEQERVFLRELNVVMLSSRVAAPNDFVTTEVVGRPVIVARGEDGRLRAFLNVCRHRGAMVERRGEGNCKRFVCPYHAWTYANDGRLARVRHAEGFPDLDAEKHGLVELPCVEAAGLVFVCPTPDASPSPLPEALVIELEQMLGPRPTAYAATRRSWRANWKLFVEGGIESYHFRVAHKDTIAPFFGDTNSTWERIGAHLRSVLPKRSVVELADVPTDQWSLRDYAHIVYTIHPNAMILLQKSHFDLIVMTPRAVDVTDIEVLTVGTSPEDGELSARALEFLQGNHDFSVRTLDEDFEIAEEIQRGLRTPANTHFRFANFEGALSDWRAWLDESLGLR